MPRIPAWGNRYLGWRRDQRAWNVENRPLYVGQAALTTPDALMWRQFISDYLHSLARGGQLGSSRPGLLTIGSGDQQVAIAYGRAVQSFPASGATATIGTPVGHGIGRPPLIVQGLADLAAPSATQVAFQLYEPADDTSLYPYAQSEQPRTGSIGLYWLALG